MRRSKKILIAIAFLLVFVYIGTGLGIAAGTKLPTERKVREIELITTTANYDPIRYEMGLTIAGKWEELGFTVKLQPMEFNRIIDQAIAEKDYDVYMVRNGSKPERIDPTFFLWEFYHSSRGKSGASYRNASGYKNPEYDRIIDAQRSELDPEKRRELIFKAQEIAANDQVLVPMMFRHQLMPYNSRDFTNQVPIMGEGLNCFWNWLKITPTGDKKVVVWGYGLDIPNLNCIDISRSLHKNQVLSLIYDTLVKYGEDGIPHPWMAENYKYVDSTTLEIKLRPDLKFHDGKTVTSEDVKFSCEFYKEVTGSSFSYAMESIEKIEIVDDLTLRMYLKRPDASFTANTLCTAVILPKHIWSKKLAELGPEAILIWTNPKPIGSGPFKFEYWRRDEELKLSRFDEYFQPAKVEGILKVTYANVQGIVDAVKIHQVDVGGWGIEPLQAKQLKSTEGVDVAEIEDFGVYNLFYNLRRSPFDLLVVRRALTHAIPKKFFTDVLLEGYAVPGTNTLIAPINKFWHNPNVRQCDYDMEKARQILKEAGFEWDDEGKIYMPVNNK